MTTNWDQQVSEQYQAIPCICHFQIFDYGPKTLVRISLECAFSAFKNKLSGRSPDSMTKWDQQESEQYQAIPFIYQLLIFNYGPKNLVRISLACAFRVFKNKLSGRSPDSITNWDQQVPEQYQALVDHNCYPIWASPRQFYQKN